MVVKDDDEVKYPPMLAKLMTDLERTGSMVRDLGDGRELCLVAQMFNVKITIGPSGAEEWDDSWEYRKEDDDAAVAAWKTWDGEGDAPGPWIRTTYGAAGGFRRRGR